MLCWHRIADTATALCAHNSMLVSCRYALTADYLQHCIKKNMYKVWYSTLAVTPALRHGSAKRHVRRHTDQQIPHSKHSCLSL